MKGEFYTSGVIKAMLDDGDLPLPFHCISLTSHCLVTAF